MGNQANVPKNNIVIALQQQNFEQTKLIIEDKLKDKQFTLDTPINKLEDRILHYASYKKDMQLIKYLISKGASTKVKNSRGLTPIEVTDDPDVQHILAQNK